jgi:glycine betaine/proline transport system ATP-binding protein
MTTMPPLIEGRGLVKIYGDESRTTWLGRRQPTSSAKPAVNNVDIAVAKGEFFIIMGLSGSGKSTLLRMFNRLVEPTAGELLVGGQSLLGMDAKELREFRNKKVNMVFQHFAIFPHRTVLENAAYGLQVRGASKTEREDCAKWALETVGLADCANSYPTALSGGMRQRVGLARALATDSEILLMDEPFSALDPLIRRDMQDLVLRLQRELQKTIVFVTHDLNEAMRLGDRIMVMRDGAVVQLGTAPEILASPADDYVADFVSDVDRSRVVTAETIMRDPLLTATLDERPADVLRRLENVEAVAAYVVDGGGHVLGVANDERLAVAVRANKQDLSDLLADDYEWVKPDTRLIDLLEKVGRHGVPLAVVDDAGRLAGVIPRAVLLNALADGKGRVVHA